MYEVVRLVVCQRFYKNNLKIIPRKCKRHFFEKRNCDFLNCRNMIVLIILFIDFVKLLFTTLCFVGLYFVPNLIVMLFNLLNSVFIVGFHCKGCVLERESIKTQATEDWRDFAGSSWLSILRKEACALHMTGMRRVRPNGDSCVSRVSCG